MFKAYILVGTFETEGEAVEALTGYEQDGTSTLIKEV